LLGAVQSMAQSVVRLAEVSEIVIDTLCCSKLTGISQEISTHRTEMEKIARQSKLLSAALAGYVDAQSSDHAEPAVLKRMVELRRCALSRIPIPVRC
jgi:hypothetical protein